MAGGADTRASRGGLPGLSRSPLQVLGRLSQAWVGKWGDKARAGRAPLCGGLKFPRNVYQTLRLNDATRAAQQGV